LLDIGCGNNKYYQQGYQTIGLDYTLKSQADIIADLNKNCILPFKDNTFDFIYMSHSLEHLTNPVDILSEVNRVGKNGIPVIIKVPHHSNFRSYEIYHRTFWNYFSFDALCVEKGKSGEHKKIFQCNSKRIVLQLSRNKRKFLRIFGSIIERIINRYPHKYESYLWLFLPAYEIIFNLRVVKFDKYDKTQS